MQQCGKTIELFRASRPVNLHPAIILVTYPAAQSEISGGFLYKPAKTDALHTAGYKPSARFEKVAQAVVSEDSKAGGFSLSTDCTAPASFFTVKGFEMSWNPLLTTYRCTTWRSS